MLAFGGCAWNGYDRGGISLAIALRGLSVERSVVAARSPAIRRVWLSLDELRVVGRLLGVEHQNAFMTSEGLFLRV